jgi:putative nucleotidyltransferase with HDIG domain
MKQRDPLEVIRGALASDRAWLVGGVIRDRALGLHGLDLDVVVEGDPRRAARALAARLREQGERAACFSLSGERGPWRVVAGTGSWQVDVEALRGGSLEADLGHRDFTINAVAEPILGGDPIDPLGGLEDLAGRRLRAVSEEAFAEDPLRVLRLVRLAVELDLELEPRTRALARASAGALEGVAGERIFMELRRIISADAVMRGLDLLGELDATAVILPELESLRGVEQSRFHHLDVYGHTRETLERVLALQADPARVVGAEREEEVGPLLEEPLADGLTRGMALRWGALLHDAAKPLTRTVQGDGRVTFFGHDERGAELAREVLTRLRTSERLRAHVSALVRHHLRAGYLVHEPQPLSERSVFRYLRACEPVPVDVTLLTIADRLATRGDRSGEAIDAHMDVIDRLLGAALRWRRSGPPESLLRGDELSRELGIGPGPRIGELVEELAEARYAGEISTREEAVALAHKLA